MPKASSIDLEAAAARDFIHAIHNPSPVSLLSPVGDRQIAALEQHDIISATVTDVPPTPTLPKTPTVPQASPHF
jgi:hypothetical protein